MQIIRFIFHYCFTKKIIFIFLFLFFLLISLFLMSIIGVNQSMSYTEVIENYSYNSIFYSKILIVLLSCYLFMNIQNDKSLFTINFIVSSGKKKYIYLIDYIIINSIIIFLFTLITFILYFIIGVIVKNYFYLMLNIMYNFFVIFLLAIYYGLITIFLIQSIRNNIGLIISFFLFLLSELLIDDFSILINIFKFILPNFSNSLIFSIEQLIEILILIIFLILLNNLIFIKNDLIY